MTVFGRRKVYCVTSSVQYVNMLAFSIKYSTRLMGTCVALMVVRDKTIYSDSLDVLFFLSKQQLLHQLDAEIHTRGKTVRGSASALTVIEVLS